MKQQQISEISQQPEKRSAKFRTLILKIGKRNMVIAASVLLIGVAVWLNWMLFTGDTGNGGYDGYDQPSGSVQETPNTEVNQGTYFSATQVSRQRARDEAIEVLQAVADNVDADEATRAEALAGISAIAEEMQKEADIESLITAKGFEQCVAVLNGDTVSVVVSADSLQAAQIAQINEIVYSQTGIAPSGVTIIHK